MAASNTKPKGENFSGLHFFTGVNITAVLTCIGSGRRNIENGYVTSWEAKDP